jgi:hypothetical protein
MSSLIVRNAFAAKFVEAFPDEMLIESLSIAIENAVELLPPAWYSFLYSGSDARPVSIGRPTCWREEGYARLYCATKSGNGPSAGVARIDDVRDAFRNWRVLAPDLRVTAPLPATTAPESDGRWLLIYTDLLYRFDYIA